MPCPARKRPAVTIFGETHSRRRGRERAVPRNHRVRIYSVSSLPVSNQPWLSAVPPAVNRTLILCGPKSLSTPSSPRCCEGDSMGRIKIGLCGHGYWGQNLFRTLSSDPGFDVVAVSDIRECAREKVRRARAAIRLYEDAVELIEDPNIEAV